MYHGYSNRSSKHTDLNPSTLRSDQMKFRNVLDWMKSADIKNADSMKLVSHSSGMMCTDSKINSDDSESIGRSILRILDGGNFTTALPTKLKCKTLADLQKKVKINKRDTVLKPLLLFTRLALVAQRELSLSL